MIDISSNLSNDILLTGVFPATIHFNGVSWFRDDQVFDVYGERNFIVKKSDYRDDTFAMTGWIYGNVCGIVAIAKRENKD